jgi:FKBP-type peptidyl-prolyl cis-trans isomerase
LPPEKPVDYKGPLVKANQHMVRTEDEQIRDYIARYGWNMKETPTGLRYIIYHHGTGRVAAKGMLARINYRVSLINGTPCYSSKETGPKEFVIGQGKVENGIEEGILLLREGDRAKFILPSHLAFGLVGDQRKIPERATLVYDIELISVSYIQ